MAEGDEVPEETASAPGSGVPEEAHVTALVPLARGEGAGDQGDVHVEDEVLLPELVGEHDGFWRRLGKGLAAVGRVVGGTVSDAWSAVDPDMRRQLLHLPLAGLTALGPGRAQVKPLEDDGHRPVVFVHGLGGHRGNFGILRAWFAIQGRTRTYAVHFPKGASLDTMARQLAAYLGEVVRTNRLDDLAQIDLVAHSMGGLISRLALEDAAVARRVHTLVTLGTPHHGTHAARYAATHQSLQLRPGSPVLERLAVQEPWQGPPRLVCFWSDADMMMLPAETARVEGADNIEVPGTSHLAWLLVPAVAERALGALQAWD